MGIFRKTLEDAKKKAAKGELNEVLKILQDRKTDCTYAQSDLLGLKQGLGKYEKSVREAIAEVNNQINKPKKDLKEIDKKITSILYWLYEFKRSMRRLIKDEKVKLE